LLSFFASLDRRLFAGMEFSEPRQNKPSDGYFYRLAIELFAGVADQCSLDIRSVRRLRINSRRGF